MLGTFRGLSMGRCLAVVALCLAVGCGPDLSGDWSAAFGACRGLMVLAQEGGDISGTLSCKRAGVDGGLDGKLDGTVVGDKLSMSMTAGLFGSAIVSADIKSPDRLEGTVTVQGEANPFEAGKR